ncbi:hypothetical protein RRG08_036361 [Elysia crispata]|uniref:Uncharacterized protein n=1 Tax=Elysia crispata TaxID=231223 RepID=A0AAE1DHD1_9GAST|nr:hypothetical protein RRG08_036361 [Elysia crispata]
MSKVSTFLRKEGIELDAQAKNPIRSRSRHFCCTCVVLQQTGASPAIPVHVYRADDTTKSVSLKLYRVKGEEWAVLQAVEEAGISQPLSLSITGDTPLWNTKQRERGCCLTPASVKGVSGHSQSCLSVSLTHTTRERMLSDSSVSQGRQWSQPVLSVSVAHTHNGRLKLPGSEHSKHLFTEINCSNSRKQKWPITTTSQKIWFLAICLVAPPPLKLPISIRISFNQQQIQVVMAEDAPLPLANTTVTSG